MLDTKISSYIIKGMVPKERLEKKKIVISSIVASELYFGAYKKGSLKLMEIVEAFLHTFEIITYDAKAAKEYGKLRAQLEKRGQMIGAYDLQIAAHAKALKAVLVTNNEKEFKRVDGLFIENWSGS